MYCYHPQNIPQQSNFELQQLPQVEKIDPERQNFGVKWILDNGRRKPCLCFNPILIS